MNDTAEHATQLEDAQLVRATRRFAVEDRRRSWWALTTTVIAIASCIAIIVGAEPLLAGAGLHPAAIWAMRIGASGLLALVYVRLFIMFHDYVHGAMFRKSALGRVLMEAVGLFMMTASSVWRETHDYHHRNNARMIGSAIGSYPVVSTRVWKRMPAAQRRSYRIVRHPLNMLFGYITVFAIGMCIAPFKRNPRMHWPALLSLLLHIALVSVLWVFAGWDIALLTVIAPFAISLAAGSYLFYAQHNFPEARYTSRKDWTFAGAALKSSSMFEMSPVMHWLTGNIGYHHIHHLNHMIPHYRLPEAMAEIPELQQCGRTSWRPRDIAACLRLALWDPKAGRMVSYEEAESRPAGKTPSVAQATP